ncbi:uncharacterized protein DUF3572 [Rhodovulum imhoffii]|uniref:Uncharacterized protein DUF3572 n=1 Tax=Rhodovulum imhoffii TaxID=365340 RepID=A0A2T5BR63_9RHOB|nr:DUF3572 domain-containing protein [Rhodovulum imhoffii]MBK5932572.1 hypothetical protein [Rhodovulum imhoffii]PTN01645.1 uncharacterized protein DUF3572 [Rhodovulum imhoffii]
MTQEQAETLALRALEWLVGNDELLQVFMGSAGISGQDLAERAADPDVLAGVLDFLTLDDTWVMSFCADTGEINEAPMRARQILAGPAQMHWT